MRLFVSRYRGACITEHQYPYSNLICYYRLTLRLLPRTSVRRVLKVARQSADDGRLLPQISHRDEGIWAWRVGQHRQSCQCLTPPVFVACSACAGTRRHLVKSLFPDVVRPQLCSCTAQKTRRSYATCESEGSHSLRLQCNHPRAESLLCPRSDSPYA